MSTAVPVTVRPAAAQPIPGGPTLGQIAGSRLVAFNYTATQQAKWSEGNMFHNRKELTAARPVETSDSVFAMPHFTPAYRDRYVNGSTRNTPAIDRFTAVGRRFTDALRAAADSVGTSVGGRQPVAVVQANRGQYYLAPLGYYDANEGGRVHFAGWTEPNTIRGPIVKSGDWTLQPAPDGGDPKGVTPPGSARMAYTEGKLVTIAPLTPAVKALVDRHGWYDLRKGSTPFEQATATS